VALGQGVAAGFGSAGRTRGDVSLDLWPSRADFKELLAEVDRTHWKKPGLVQCGQARLLAAAATRQRAFSTSELAGADREQREALRRQIESLRQRRAQRSRFRRDPQAYLQALAAISHNRTRIAFGDTGKTA
jgi:hypothetical protein